MRKMQICSPDYFTGIITASPSSSLWVSFEKVAWPLVFVTDKVIHPSQQSFLNHDPLKTRGSWMIELFEDCI